MRGMTIVEVMIVSLIVASLGLVLIVAWLVSNKLYVSSEASVYVQGEARRAFDEIAEELREAGGAITTTPAAAGPQLDFQVALGYDLPVPCPAGAVCWGARDAGGVPRNGWRVRYRLNGSQLTREILDAGGVVQLGTRVLANEVSQVVFTYAVAPTRTVTVQLQVRYTSNQVASGSQSVSPVPLVIRIRLRNT